MRDPVQVTRSDCPAPGWIPDGGTNRVPAAAEPARPRAKASELLFVEPGVDAGTGL